MKRRVATQLPPEADGLQLLDYLSSRFAYHSSSQWLQKITDSEIALDGSICRDPAHLLLRNMLLEYFPASLVEPEVRRDYRIIYEDEFLLVIDKPGNLPVHPAGPYFSNTLWAMLVDAGYGKVHLVNRLDRETSGLLIAAKQAKTAGDLNKTLPDMEKCYEVLVHGDFSGNCTVSGYLVSDETSSIRKKKKFVYNADAFTGAAAVETEFSFLRGNQKYSLLSARLHTGRMHQIRATLHAVHFPVVGDKLYGLDEQFYRRFALGTLSQADREQLVLERQALHCSKLCFVHPASSRMMSFASDTPDEFLQLLA